MDIKWTPEQENAITFRGKAAIVSAAAGSGKTAVLVERVKRMLLDENDPVNADELVISTFTQKAAAEMKSRLEAALDAELAKAPDNARLIDQRMRLNDASISTISSFCLGILRKYSARLDVPPDFSVLDESEAKLIYAGALSEVMENFCASADKKERDLLFDWYAGEDDKRAAGAVSYLYNFSRNIPYSDAYFRRRLDIYRGKAEIDPDTRHLLDMYLYSNVQLNAQAISELCGELETQCVNTPAEDFALEWRELSEIWISRFDYAHDDDEEDEKNDPFSDHITEERCAESYEAAKDIPLPALPRKTKDFDNTYIKELHSGLKERWGELMHAAGLVARRESDMSTCAPVLKILIKLAEKLDEEYSARKRARGKVDFSDIELMTLRLLRGKNGGQSETAREIAGGISEIIVDEFQDSNEIQYEIFRLISKDKKNLYFVGDIKQSIYRFRGADPLVFARLSKSRDFKVIPLNRNFRSCGEVIDAVNGIFTGTMTEQLGDVDYNESCALVKGTDYPDDETHRAELITFSSAHTEDSRISEAAYIADRIKSMVRSGFTVGKGDKRRPCGYGDFAVLMGRYSANIPIYKAALERAGVPFEAKDDGGYTDFTEIRHAISLLRVIDDPYRDSDLAAVLMREPYLFSADEMAQIKLAGGKKRKNLWPGLIEYAKDNAHAAAVLNELNGFREFASESSAERLIRRICDESMLLPAAEASPDGMKRGANLRRLIHYARSFSGGESAGLYDFIKYMENLDREKIDLVQAQGETAAEDRVHVMTIHGSKGLEFPICFVANLSSTKRPSDGGGMVCDPKYGIGMKINDHKHLLTIETQMYEMAAQENDRLEMSEEMRLLYVAATRAKEKLIFTAPVTSRTKPAMHYGWVLGSRAVRNGLIEVRNYDGYTVGETAEKTELVEKETVLKPFTGYAYGKFSRIPAKVTATQIGVKSIDDFAEYGDKIDRFLRVPSFIGTVEEKTKLTGKKRGDAYHKVMELIDFNCAPSDVPGKLDEMLIHGKLSDIERVSVDEADIAAFLKSGLCARAAKSGEIYREFPIFCEYTPTEAESGISDWTGEEKPFIQGIADMFFIEDGEIVLVDYKTNRGVTEAQLVEEYRGQLDIYARALSEATGMRVKEKLLYSFALGVVPVEKTC